MPKIKTNKGAKKRFRVNKSGKVKHRRAFRNHILTKKAQGRKRNLRRNGILCERDAVLVRRLLALE
ncbi:MAG TPA: 50S ribosomal protein L35 [Gammaproteobacteria bacterium]|nr:50S ribosomal protein L35 [Gammaproteobacteria bacterium]